MTIDFQDNVLRFCLKTKHGKRFITLLDDTCFDLADRKFIYSLVITYLEKYQTMPTRINLIEFFTIEVRKMPGVTAEAKNIIMASINILFQDNFVTDTVIIRDEIIRFSQRKQSKNVFLTKSDKVATGDDAFFDSLLKDFGKIVNLGKDHDIEANRGKFLFKDYNGFKFTMKEAHPTFLSALNKMTSSGGFKTPELIIIMSQPKGFKTGVCINLAMEYARSGLKGYYVDCENGKEAIEARCYQQMAQSTKRDLMRDEDEAVLGEMVKRYGVMGGDLKIDFYPAYTQDCNDVDANLQFYFDEYGYIPDFIIWDYPDLLVPIDKSIKEKRLKIQAVYHDIIRLHNKWGVFGIAISQVSKGAVNKEFIDMTDFAEDFGKAANAHAAFAICRTVEEVEAGTGRIIPVMQREGSTFTGTEICYLKIEPEIQLVTEIIMKHPGAAQITTGAGAVIDNSTLNDD